MVHNQFFVVPRQLSADFQRYLFKRKPSCSRSKTAPPVAQTQSPAAIMSLLDFLMLPLCAGLIEKFLVG
jgi:hypothetical protein